LEEQVAALFAQLSPDCAKQKACDIEFTVLDLAKLNSEIIIPYANSSQSAVREAVAFIGGKLIQRGIASDGVKDMLGKLCDDPDHWVRKKAIKMSQ